MKRIARIALTPHGQDNVNRLRIPEFDVVKLYLEAGNKSSKTHFPEGVTEPEEENDGTDDFHFAPGAQLCADTWMIDSSKKDPVKIVYKLNNPFLAIENAKLELFCRFDSDPIWERELKDEELLDGEHILEFDGDGEWDGKISAHAKFPDEFLTIEHSPYKLKMTLEGTGVCGIGVAWTYFHILLGKIKLEYGPEEVLPKPQENKGDHRKVLKEIKAQDKDPSTEDIEKIKVFMESNIFRAKEEELGDNTLYDKYEKFWGDGPQIPLFATIWIKDSKDQDVLAPGSLGKLRFIWDWESKSKAMEEIEYRDNHAFVNDAQDYLVNATKPKGQNCHKDRGGKRGDNAKPVFPRQAGYDPKEALDDGIFPFKVEACPAERKWAAVSYPWRDKELACKTGVIFQPARMAGDAYIVTVYAAYNVGKDGKMELDKDDDAPLEIHDSLKASTAVFETWRKLTIVKYLKKNSDINDLDIEEISKCYRPAFLELEDKNKGAVGTVSREEWNKAFDKAVDALFSEFDELSEEDKLIFYDSSEQHQSGSEGVFFRNCEDFQYVLMENRIKKKLTAHQYSDDEAANVAKAALTALWEEKDVRQAAYSALMEEKYDDYEHWDDLAIDVEKICSKANEEMNAEDSDYSEEKYPEYIETFANLVLIKVFDDLQDKEPGINIFHTGLIHNYSEDPWGLAYTSTSGDDKKCGFIVMGERKHYDDLSSTIEDHSAHEIGHQLFLPHTKGIDTDEEGDGIDYKAHDENVRNCLMSHNDISKTKLCGFCQLRLRGWDKERLDVDGAKNKKTQDFSDDD